jgi:sporulation protein YlmC with PRC-barrel domain
LVPQGKQEQGGLVQKQGAQSPPPGTYNCLSQPKASQNTQTLSSANPLPEKKGQLVGKVVYGKGGEEVGKIQAEVTPQGCDVTAVLVNIGGFIGIGGEQVEIPMQELKQEGDKLVATSMSAQDINNMQPVTARK